MFIGIYSEPEIFPKCNIIQLRKTKKKHSENARIKKYSGLMFIDIYSAPEIFPNAILWSCEKGKNIHEMYRAKNVDEVQAENKPYVETIRAYHSFRIFRPFGPIIPLILLQDSRQLAFSC